MGNLMKPKYGAARNIVLIGWVALGCLFRCAPMRAQTPDEVEKSIANLPPERRAYERFRAWVNALPPEQQRDGKENTRYRGYLKSRGSSEAQAEVRIKVGGGRGAGAEVERATHV